MFKKIMAPVDLAHLGRIEHALGVTADLAKHYGAEVVYVSVTTGAPSKVAHNPKEFGEKLDAFAAREAETHAIKASGHVAMAHDPTTDVDDALLKAAGDTGADLVVMASHKPGLAEYFWPSNGGKLAAHTGLSVMLVRDA